MFKSFIKTMTKVSPICLIPLNQSIKTVFADNFDVSFDDIKKAVSVDIDENGVENDIFIYRSSKLQEELDKNTSLIIKNNGGKVNQISSCFYNANNPIEDRHKISETENGHLIGVFDGHGGASAAEFCKNELFDFLEYYRNNTKEKELLNKNAFLFADNCFLDLAIREKNYDKAASGACAVVAHINNNNILTVANLGDCKCVLAERNENGKLIAIDMNKEHKISLNSNERKRLLSLHKEESNIIHRNRIKGGLQPTRGIGDGKYKRMEVFVKKNKRKNLYWNPPYSSSTPEIKKIQLKPSSEYIFLGSDGIFDNLTSQQIIDSIESKTNCKNDISNFKKTSSEIIQRSLSNRIEQMIGRTNENKMFYSLLNVKAGKGRRKVHDDMTAIVIKLNRNDKIRMKMEKLRRRTEIEPKSIVKIKKAMFKENNN